MAFSGLSLSKMYFLFTFSKTVVNESRGSTKCKENKFQTQRVDRKSLI